MLCEKCGQNPATVRFVHVENGQKTEVNLCQACAQGYSSGFAVGFDLQNILANMFDLPKMWGAVAAPDQRRCPTCNSSLADIQKRAQLAAATVILSFRARWIHCCAAFTPQTGTWARFQPQATPRSAFSARSRRNGEQWKNVCDPSGLRGQLNCGTSAAAGKTPCGRKMDMRDVSQALSAWMRGSGPEGDIVLGSRIRLARNLKGIPFPALRAANS